MNSKIYYPYYRKPTQSEIRFGEGVIHVIDIPLNECLRRNNSGKPKHWVEIDGLRYTLDSAYRY